MASVWFLLRDGRRFGPFPFDQLRQMTTTGQLLPVDLLAQAEGGPWVPATRVPGFFGLTPPPTPSATAQEAEAPFDFGRGAERQTDASSRTDSEERRQRRAKQDTRVSSSRRIFILAAGGMLFLIATGVYLAGRTATTRTNSTGKQDEIGRPQHGTTRPGSAAINLSYAGGFEAGSAMGKQQAEVWSNPNLTPLTRQSLQKQFAKTHDENVKKYEEIRGLRGESNDAVQRLKGIADGYREELQKVGFPFTR